MVLRFGLADEAETLGNYVQPDMFCRQRASQSLDDIGFWAWAWLRGDSRQSGKGVIAGGTVDVPYSY